MAQTRLTKQRAKYGLSGSVSQAKSLGRGSPEGGNSGPPIALGGDDRPVSGSASRREGRSETKTSRSLGTAGSLPSGSALRRDSSSRAAAERPSGERPSWTS